MYITVKISYMKPTKFSQKVYHLCSQIPKGKISTYKFIAIAAYGSSQYARVVGTLLSRCPDCELISDNHGGTDSYLSL